jgi:hypothetical protein
MKARNLKIFSVLNSRNRKIFISTTLLLFVGISELTSASPIPGSGSSELASPLRNFVFHRKGFDINPSGLSGSFQDVAEKSSELKFQLQDQKSSGKFYVQTETLNDGLSLESYMRKWIKEYRAYGFEILSHHPFAQNNAKGYVVDLFYNKNALQQRQAVFLKDGKIVTITCADAPQNFEKTLKTCNQILKNFRWL